jgi:hypothetical protein
MVSPLYSGRLGLERGQLNGSLLYRGQLGLEMGQLNDKPAVQESVRFREGSAKWLL